MTTTGSRDGAAVLREAARVMRERAEATTQGAQWTLTGDHAVVGHYWIASYDEYGDPVQEEIGGMGGRGDAEHYSSWSPAVALAVADWLEREAALATLLDMAGNTEQPEVGDTEHYALAVATAYLTPQESP